MLHHTAESLLGGGATFVIFLFFLGLVSKRHKQVYPFEEKKLPRILVALHHHTCVLLNSDQATWPETTAEGKFLGMQKTAGYTSSQTVSIEIWGILFYAFQYS